MWGRATAGILPGFFVTAAWVGLVSWLLPGPWQSTLVGGALAFFPIWMGVITLAFAFRNGKRAWLTYVGAAGLGLLLLWGLRYLQWVH